MIAVAVAFIAYPAGRVPQKRKSVIKTTTYCTHIRFELD